MKILFSVFIFTFQILSPGYEIKSPYNQVYDLPVVITKATTNISKAPIALLISGDGGWYKFEQTIADTLAKSGIPTLGLDCRKYFWDRKTPEGTAADMENLLDYYSKEWGKENFLLIGYSQGAEIIPFIVTRLPEEMKGRISSAILLSPATTTDFEIHLTNMLGAGNRHNIYKVTDEINSMKGVPVLIIFGSKEKTELPGFFTGTDVRIKKIPGDHHYQSNVSLIVKTIKESNAF